MAAWIAVVMALAGVLRPVPGGVDVVLPGAGIHERPYAWAVRERTTAAAPSTIDVYCQARAGVRHGTDVWVFGVVRDRATGAVSSGWVSRGDVVLAGGPGRRVAPPGHTDQCRRWTRMK